MKFIVSYSYLEKVRIKLNKEILEKKKKKCFICDEKFHFTSQCNVISVVTATIDICSGVQNKLISRTYKTPHTKDWYEMPFCGLF